MGELEQIEPTKTSDAQAQASHEVRLTFEQMGTLVSVAIVVLFCLAALAGVLWLTPWGEVIIKRVNEVADTVLMFIGVTFSGVGGSWIKGFADRRFGPAKSVTP